MWYMIKKRFQTSVIGFLLILMLFGCAGVKEINVSQKYEDSKTWFKEKWNAMGSKFSASKDEESSVKPQDQNPPRALTDEQQVDYFEHKVQWHGETLSLIAKWYTGHYGNWKALARANPKLNPNRIVVGDIIRIPAKMMKSKKPLPRKVVAKSLPNYYAHTVRQPDEKLTDIAEWYTGKADNAKLLSKANPELDPEFLLVGNEIYIPADLLKTRKPFYKKSIQVSTTRPAEQPAAPTAPAPRKKKIELFGPKQFPTH
jgi:hypothetical protein